MALRSQELSYRKPTTHRDCPSKLPWNAQGLQDDDLQLDDSSDEDHVALKVVLSFASDTGFHIWSMRDIFDVFLISALFSQTVIMNGEDVVTDSHLHAQYSEGDHQLILTRLHDNWQFLIKLLRRGPTTMSVPWRWTFRKKVRLDCVNEHHLHHNYPLRSGVVDQRICR